ncbi:hypothetical protein [Spirosoma fluminis]
MTTQKSLSNLQIELLKLYANDLPNDQLQDIKLMLARYFANKATEAMDKVWQEQGLTEQDMVDWSNEHNRAAHRP